jgi:hypothetical protein
MARSCCCWRTPVHAAAGQGSGKGCCSKQSGCCRLLLLVQFQQLVRAQAAETGVQRSCVQLKHCSRCGHRWLRAPAAAAVCCGCHTG